jgi:hypothetical protein
VPREADREAVRVGRRERELPVGQTEAAGELLADPSRVLRREHERQAARACAAIASATSARAWPGHRAGVAEAEVEVLEPVGVR